MKNKVKIAKGLLSVLLVFLFSINSFAINVGDNDGSAFITKSEFDSLKSSFQSQIDTYNQGIDSKIDNAIAAYLGGIKLEKKPTDYYATINSNAGGILWWRRTVGGADQGTENVTPDVTLSVTRHVSLKDLEAYHQGVLIEGLRTLDKDGNPFIKLHGVGNFLGPSSGLGASEIYKVVFRLQRGRTDSALWIPEDTWGTTATWKAVDPTVTFDGGNLPAYGYLLGSNVTTNWKKVWKNYTTQSNQSSSGSGSRYVYETDVAGRRYLKSYMSKYYPVVNINVWRHNFANYQTGALWATHHTVDHGLDFKDATAVTIDTTSIIKSVGKSSNGTKWGDNTEHDGENYIGGLVSIVSEKADIDYTTMTWGQNVTSYMWANDITDALEIDGTATIDAADVDFYDLYQSQGGGQQQTNTMSGFTVKYNKFILPKRQMLVKDFVNYPASTARGQDIYHGEGVPFCRSNTDVENQKIKIKFLTNNPSWKNVHYTISDGKFTNNAVTAGNLTLAEADVMADVETEITFDMKANTEYWINVHSFKTGIPSSAASTMAGIEYIKYVE